MDKVLIERDLHDLRQRYEAALQRSGSLTVQRFGDGAFVTLYLDDLYDLLDIIEGR